MKFNQTESQAMLAAREGRLLSALDRVIAFQKWSRREILDFQFKSLQALVYHAFETVPFYRAKYTAAGFNPEELRSLADLSRIPVLTKDELRRADPEHLKSTQVTGATYLLASSGSTGVPGRIWRDEESLWQITARNLVWYYDICKGKPLDNALYVVDLAPDSIDCLLSDFLRTLVHEERLVSVTEPTPLLIEKIDEFQPDFISSYPSTMRNIAFVLRERGETYEPLRLLHLTAEMLDQRTRNVLEKVFPNAQLIESYTSTEAGLVAYPCTEGHLHLAEEGGLYEILDAEGNATEEQGRLVVTDLTNQATPIIRYDGLGDYCRWAKTECACASPFRAISHLEGRAAESLLLPGNIRLSPYVLTNALEEVEGICQYQVIQYAVDDFELLVVRDKIGKSAEAEIDSSLRQIIARVAGDTCRCRVTCVERILPKAGAHKVPLVISHVRRSS
jgi:phenylacetate-CoA ligase